MAIVLGLTINQSVEPATRLRAHDCTGLTASRSPERDRGQDSGPRHNGSPSPESTTDRLAPDSGRGLWCAAGASAEPGISGTGENPLGQSTRPTDLTKRAGRSLDEARSTTVICLTDHY